MHSNSAHAFVNTKNYKNGHMKMNECIFSKYFSQNLIADETDTRIFILSENFIRIEYKVLCCLSFKVDPIPKHQIRIRIGRPGVML